MLSRNETLSDLHGIEATNQRLSTWRSIRPRRPSSVWGWIVWLVFALLFYLIISYVLVPWWYKPVPTDVPPPTAPNSNNTRTGKVWYNPYNASTNENLQSTANGRNVA